MQERFLVKRSEEATYVIVIVLISYDQPDINLDNDRPSFRPSPEGHRLYKLGTQQQLFL